MSAAALPGGARACRFWVSGRVQGVGFRWYVRRAAQELGLAGRVRNLPDGRVEVVAVGEPEALNAFRARLREGPPGAGVEGRPQPLLGYAEVLHEHDDPLARHQPPHSLRRRGRICAA